MPSINVNAETHLLLKQLAKKKDISMGSCVDFLLSEVQKLESEAQELEKDKIALSGRLDSLLTATATTFSSSQAIITSAAFQTTAPEAKIHRQKQQHKRRRG